MSRQGIQPVALALIERLRSAPDAFGNKAPVKLRPPIKF